MRLVSSQPSQVGGVEELNVADEDDLDGDALGGEYTVCGNVKGVGAFVSM